MIWTPDQLAHMMQATVTVQYAVAGRNVGGIDHLGSSIRLLTDDA